MVQMAALMWPIKTICYAALVHRNRHTLQVSLALLLRHLEYS
jgi:hypothetical protein